MLSSCHSFYTTKHADCLIYTNFTYLGAIKQGNETNTVSMFSWREEVWVITSYLYFRSSVMKLIKVYEDTQYENILNF